MNLWWGRDFSYTKSRYSLDVCYAELCQDTVHNYDKIIYLQKEFKKPFLQKYSSSLNDVPNLKHMLLMFNEIQMHKIGTDGKRNSLSLCFAAA
jgi:hypothetical protein